MLLVLETSPKMMKIFLVACLVCASLGVDAAAVGDDGPVEEATVADILACQIDSPKRDECLKASIDHIIPKLHSGLKAVHIPPLDPFVLDNTPINFNQGNAVQVNGFIKARLRGFKHCQLKSVKSNITKKTLEVDMVATIPRIQVDGSYKGKGRFNLLNMNSKVSFNVSMSDATANIKVVGAFEDRNGERHLRVTGFDVKPSNVADFKIQMKGLFPDEQMNQITVDFMNSNWRLMYKDMIQTAKVVWEPLLIEATNQITLNEIPFRAFMFYSDEGVYKIVE